MIVAGNHVLCAQVDKRADCRAVDSLDEIRVTAFDGVAEGAEGEQRQAQSRSKGEQASRQSAQEAR